jgi:hypothetical protein
LSNCSSALLKCIAMHTISQLVTASCTLQLANSLCVRNKAVCSKLHGHNGRGCSFIFRMSATNSFLPAPYVCQLQASRNFAYVHYVLQVTLTSFR